MTWYTFGSRSAISTDGDLLTEGSGQFYQLGDTSFGTPLAIRDPQSESAMSEVLVSSQGATQTYQAEVAIGLWKSNDGPAILMVSEDGLVEQVNLARQAAADSAAAALASAQAASTSGLPPSGSLGNVLTWGASGPIWALPSNSSSEGGSFTSYAQVAALPDYPPGGFASADHTQPVSSLRRAGNATLPAFLLDFLNAASPDEARGKISAGIGNGTSNVTVNGGTSGAAMSATKVFKADEISLAATIAGVTSSTVQGVLVELAGRATGGGGTGYAWNVDYNFTTSSWPARPTGVPAGWALVWRGPSLPPIGGVYAIGGLDEFRRKDS